MWARFRRRSMAPRRPVVFDDQWALVVACVLALVGGIAVVVAVLTL
jgi:hypothetical protein